MKNPKKLKFAEHLYLQKLNMDSGNWLISKKISEFWLLVHKFTGQVKTILAP